MRFDRILAYRKDPRVVVAIPIALIIAATLIYYLVQRSNEPSPNAFNSKILLFVLWNINLILILGIVFVLARVGIKLLLERQRGTLGSHFRTKLVATWVVTSLVPIVILFLVANDLLRISIDRWFNTPVESLVANSNSIAETYQEEKAAHSRRATEAILSAVRSDEGPDLREILDEYDVEIAALFEPGGSPTMIANPRAPVHEMREPSERLLASAAEQGYAQKIDVGPSGKWIRTFLPIEGGGYAMAGVFIDASLARQIDENLIAFSEYEQLRSQRGSFKASQTSLFLTATLYILFGALWTAIYVSKRITGPVQALAEGTRTLSSGNYAHRIETSAPDELGMLIDSFNEMADVLATQRSALEESNQELVTLNERLDEDRGLLTTIQESVSVGIIAIDEDGQLLGINETALRLLSIDRPEIGARTRDWIRSEGLEPLVEVFNAPARASAKPRELSLVLDGELRYFEVRVARLEGRTARAGWVIAIEDTTELVQAQKLAAWSEAARIIAHEIKNPLTPIQLAAQRMAKRLSAAPEQYAAIARDSAAVIEREVAQLKRLVDEFSRFATMPAIHLSRSSITGILTETAELYREARPDLEIVVETESEIYAVVDAEQIKRAIVNLVDNAVHATVEGSITLSAEQRSSAVVISIADTGVGVSDEDKEKLFLPYFSNRKGGTGLGLAIVHRIVNDHEGRITVQDNRPRGTIFEIELAS